MKARNNPYVRRIIEDEDLRHNIIRRLHVGAQGLRAAAATASRRRTQIFDDKKLQKELKTAAESIKDAGYALREAPKKKKSGGIGKLLLLGIVSAGVALAVSEGLRKKVLDALFGAEEEFEYSSTTTASTPAERGRARPPDGLHPAAGHLAVRQQRDVPPQHGEHARGDRERGREPGEDRCVRVVCAAFS